MRSWDVLWWCHPTFVSDIRVCSCDVTWKQDRRQSYSLFSYSDAVRNSSPAGSILARYSITSLVISCVQWLPDSWQWLGNDSLRGGGERRWTKRSAKDWSGWIVPGSFLLHKYVGRTTSPSELSCAGEKYEGWWSGPKHPLPSSGKSWRHVCRAPAPEATWPWI